MSFVGELGWELYIPTEFSVGVYDRIIEVGSEFGLVHAGMETLESTRMEAKRLDYGLDMENSDSPLEAGLKFAIDFDKPGGFVGRCLKRRTGMDEVPGLPFGDLEVILSVDDASGDAACGVRFVGLDAVGHEIPAGHPLQHFTALGVVAHRANHEGVGIEPSQMPRNIERRAAQDAAAVGKMVE